MELRVYLAGPIYNTNNAECVGWRDEFKRRDGFAWVDPIEHGDYRGMEDAHWPEIVATDLRLIRRCDAMLANVWKDSVGTSMEIFYAHQLQIPVLAVAYGKDRAKKLSPWLRAHVVGVCTSPKAAIQWLESLK